MSGTDCTGALPEPFTPIVVRTTTARLPVGPSAFDCVKLIVPRSGSALLFGESDRLSLNVGDVLALAPATLCGLEPEGRITVTTLYLDRDYLIDQFFWRHAGVLTDRMEAGRVFNDRYPEPAHLMRLGEDRIMRLTPWLDELTALSANGPSADQFYRVQTLLHSALDVIAPWQPPETTSQPPSRRTVSSGLLPGHRVFAPLRPEAQEASRLLRSAPERRWTLSELAEAVHLSPSQLGRVFVSAFGKTPMTYLTMLRVELMATLLRKTNRPIRSIAQEAGWSDPDYATRQFRRCAGLTPQQYRALTVPTIAAR